MNIDLFQCWVNKLLLWNRCEQQSRDKLVRSFFHQKKKYRLSFGQQQRYRKGRIAHIDLSYCHTNKVTKCLNFPRLNNCHGEAQFYKEGPPFIWTEQNWKYCLRCYKFWIFCQWDYKQSPLIHLYSGNFDR